MNAGVVQQAVVDELRLCAGGKAPTMRELRLQLGFGAGELAAAVQALRYQGKLAWDRLELSPSMMAGEEPATVSSRQREETPRSVGCDEGTAGGAKPIPDDGGPNELSGGASGTAREAPSAASSGAATRDIVRAPHSERDQAAGASPGPDDEEDGGVNDVTSAQQGREGIGALPAEGEAGDVPLSLRPQREELPDGRLAQPGSDAARDQPAGAELPGQAAPARAAAGAPLGGGFVPKALLHKAGIHAAGTRAANKAPPPPRHEPEISRLVREEVSETMNRRARSRSTATVRQPLECRKFGVPDLSFTEGVQSLLAEHPNDLMAAISRKHIQTWRRILLLARARGERPAQTLYAVLERGLAELGAAPPTAERDAA